MRILLVIDHLGTGGAQRQLVNLGVQLHRFGHHVEFFTYYPMRDLREPLDGAGIRVFESCKASRYSPRVPFALRKHLRAGAYDVALSYLDTPNLYLELASAGVPKTKIVVSQRAQYPAGKLPLVKRMLENFHRFSDHVVVNSQTQRLRMIEEFPWIGDRVSTIFNGVHASFFEVQRQSRTRRNLRILTVATVVPLKNPEGLIEAVGLCRREAGLDVEVLWAGRVPDQQYVQILQRRIDELGLGNQWRWLGQCTDVPGLMRECDVLVHPSHSEGFPNAICEALAAGMPILASNVGDHEMLVNRSGAGRTFDPAQPRDIATALMHMGSLTSDEHIALGDNARRYATQHLSIELCASRYEALFGRLTQSEIASCAA